MPTAFINYILDKAQSVFALILRSTRATEKARLTLVLLCCNICKKMLSTKMNCVIIRMEIMK